MAYCKKCGQQLNDGTVFCPACGENNGANQGAPVNQGQQQGYQQQGYQRPMNGGGNGLGMGLSIAGLSCGGLSIFLFWIPWFNFFSLALAIAGLVCSVIGRKKSMLAGASTALGTAGLIVSIVSTVVNGIAVFTCTICLCACSGAGAGLNPAYWSNWL